MYKLFFYENIGKTIEDSTFNGKLDLHCLLGIDIDEDKLIDDDFFSFEAKRMEIRFMDNGSGLALKLLSYLNSSDYLLRNYPKTIEGVQQQPVETSFLNRKLRVEINNETCFVGVPDLSSFSYDASTQEYSMSFVSLPYLIFDNMENLEMSMFLSMVANETFEVSIDHRFYANVFLAWLMVFLCDYGINTGYSENFLFNYALQDINFANALLFYRNENFASKSIIDDNRYQHSQFGEFQTPYLATDSMRNAGNTVSVIYHQAFKASNTIPFKIYLQQYGQRGNKTFEKLITAANLQPVFRAMLNVSINKENFMTLDDDLGLVLPGDMVDTVFAWSKYSKHNKTWTAKTTIHKNKNKIIEEVSILFERKYPGGNAGEYDNTAFETLLYENFLTNLDAQMQAVFDRQDTVDLSHTDNNVEMTFHTGYPKATLSGSISPKLHLVTKRQPDGSLMVTNDSDGIFNPDKFNIKTFFKYILALSGLYMRLGYKEGKTFVSFEPFSINQTNSQYIASKHILRLTADVDYVDLNKQFQDADYSETDWHYLIRAIIHSYKSLAGKLKKVYTCEIIKNNDTANLKLAVTETVHMRVGKNVLYFFINSVKEEEDFYTLELIQYNIKKSLDILKEDNYAAIENSL